MKLIMGILVFTFTGLIYAQHTAPIATNRPSIKMCARPTTLLGASRVTTTNQRKWHNFQANQSIVWHTGRGATNSLTLTNATRTKLPPATVDGTNAPPAAP